MCSGLIYVHTGQTSAAEFTDHLCMHLRDEKVCQDNEFTIVVCVCVCVCVFRFQSAIHNEQRFSLTEVGIWQPNVLVVFYSVDYKLTIRRFIVEIVNLKNSHCCSICALTRNFITRNRKQQQPVAAELTETPLFQISSFGEGLEGNKGENGRKRADGLEQKGVRRGK